MFRVLRVLLAVIALLIAFIPFQLSYAVDSGGQQPLYGSDGGIRGPSNSVIQSASSSSGNALVDTICMIVVVMQGRVGRVIGMVFIISGGYLFFLGKINWQWIIVGCVGLGILFGAKSIVVMILPKYMQTIDANGNKTVSTASKVLETACPSAT